MLKTRRFIPAPEISLPPLRDQWSCVIPAISLNLIGIASHSPFPISNTIHFSILIYYAISDAIAQPPSPVGLTL